MNFLFWQVLAGVSLGLEKRFGLVWYVLDEVGLVGAGGVDWRRRSGFLAAAAQSNIGATEKCGQSGHGELEGMARCQYHCALSQSELSLDGLLLELGKHSCGGTIGGRAELT